MASAFFVRLPLAISQSTTAIVSRTEMANQRNSADGNPVESLGCSQKEAMRLAMAGIAKKRENNAKSAFDALGRAQLRGDLTGGYRHSYPERNHQKSFEWNCGVVWIRRVVPPNGKDEAKNHKRAGKKHQQTQSDIRRRRAWSGVGLLAGSLRAVREHDCPRQGQKRAHDPSEKRYSQLAL